MENLSYFIYSGHDNMSPICFQEGDGNLEKISLSLKEFILTEMKNYYCQGCRYCCYGYEHLQYKCEKIFTKDNELSEYLTLIGYPTSPEIRKITFIETDSPGYFREEEIVWTVKYDPTYPDHLEIRF